MPKIKKYTNRGFTIIETLIVIAIAATVITIVLLSLPALQRTSRNSNIKNDATAVVGAINEYGANTGNLKPEGVSQNGSTVDICSCSDCTTVAGTCTNTVGSTATVKPTDKVKAAPDTGCAEPNPCVPYNLGGSNQVPPGSIAIEFGTTSAGFLCYSTTNTIPTSLQGYGYGSWGVGAPSQIPVYYTVETGSSQIGVWCIQA